MGHRLTDPSWLFLQNLVPMKVWERKKGAVSSGTPKKGLEQPALRSKRTRHLPHTGDGGRVCEVLRPTAWPWSPQTSQTQKTPDPGKGEAQTPHVPALCPIARPCRCLCQRPSNRRGWPLCMAWEKRGGCVSFPGELCPLPEAWGLLGASQFSSLSLKIWARTRG